MIQKFGVYDFLANLIPGLAFVWAVTWIGQFLNSSSLVPIAGSLAETTVLIAWAFIVGLLIQGIAQGGVEKIDLATTCGLTSARWLLEGERGLSPEYRDELKKAIGAYFTVSVEPNLANNIEEKDAREVRLRRYQELFYLCYNLVELKKLSDRPLAFNAHYGLFRALLTLSLILLPLFSSVAIWKWQAISQQGAAGLFGSVIVFLVLSSVISYFRMKKRGEDFAKSVYDLFFTFYKQGKCVHQ